MLVSRNRVPSCASSISSPPSLEPFPAYAERLDRVMTDVSSFFREGMRRFGVPYEGLPLERKGEKLVLHVVRGKLPADQYHHSSGDVAKAEIHDGAERFLRS